MKIQDLLGLPMHEGINRINQKNLDIKIVETLPRKRKIEQNHLKDPYIIRIREIDNNLTEILISYF